MEDYEVVKTLGSGAFGSVNKVVRRVDRKAFAMKKVQIGRMEEREVADALNECRILASVRHPRVVNFEVSGAAHGDRPGGVGRGRPGQSVSQPARQPASPASQPCLRHNPPMTQNFESGARSPDRPTDHLFVE